MRRHMHGCFAGSGAFHAVFPLVVDRPEMLGILAGMYLKDRVLWYTDAENCGFSAVAVHRWSSSSRSSQLLFDKEFDVPGVRFVQVPQLQAVQETVVPPQFQLVENLVAFPEVLTVVDMPVLCNGRCRRNCGVSAVAARQGLRAELMG